MNSKCFLDKHCHPLPLLLLLLLRQQDEKHLYFWIIRSCLYGDTNAKRQLGNNSSSMYSICCVEIIFWKRKIRRKGKIVTTTWPIEGTTQYNGINIAIPFLALLLKKMTFYIARLFFPFHEIIYLDHGFAQGSGWYWQLSARLLEMPPVFRRRRTTPSCSIRSSPVCLVTNCRKHLSPLSEWVTCFINHGLLLSGAIKMKLNRDYFSAITFRFRVFFLDSVEFVCLGLSGTFRVIRIGNDIHICIQTSFVIKSFWIHMLIVLEARTVKVRGWSDAKKSSEKERCRIQTDRVNHLVDWLCLYNKLTYRIVDRTQSYTSDTDTRGYRQCFLTTVITRQII